MQLSRLVPIRERVFGAARRPRQTQIKNNFSAEYGQSETEAIKIVYPIGSASATVKNAKP